MLRIIGVENNIFRDFTMSFPSVSSISTKPKFVINLLQEVPVDNIDHTMLMSGGI